MFQINLSRYYRETRETHLLPYDSSVGVAAAYWLDGPGSIPGRANVSLIHSVHTGSGPHQTS
jgi:hypothetical protein